jgi:hypothetical protein
MFAMGFAIGLVGVLLFFVFLLVPFMAFGLWWAWRARGLEQARKWPRTEATIQSAEVEVVHGTRRSSLKASICAFSYTVDGMRYSGRFSLLSGTRPADRPMRTLSLRTLVDQRLPLLYDPLRPRNWYIPMEHWRGYSLEQKMGIHSLRLYPRD